MCDRLPLSIPICPTCGEHPRFTRNIAEINPYKLWGVHEFCTEAGYDAACVGMDSAWLMWVGSDYTTRSFVEEAHRLGVSKRIPHRPEKLAVGDWVFLGRKHLIPKTGQFTLFDEIEGKEQTRGYLPGVFLAFRVHAVEKIITQSQADDGEVERLAAQDIVAVVVPNDDPDHAPRKARKTTKEEDE